MHMGRLPNLEPFLSPCACFLAFASRRSPASDFLSMRPSCWLCWLCWSYRWFCAAAHGAGCAARLVLASCCCSCCCSCCYSRSWFCSCSFGCVPVCRKGWRAAAEIVASAAGQRRAKPIAARRRVAHAPHEKGSGLTCLVGCSSGLVRSRGQSYDLAVAVCLIARVRFFCVATLISKRGT